MEDICNSQQKIFMLNILQETFFDKNLHGITGVFINYLKL